MTVMMMMMMMMASRPWPKVLADTTPTVLDISSDVVDISFPGSGKAKALAEVLADTKL